MKARRKESGMNKVQHSDAERASLHMALPPLPYSRCPGLLGFPCLIKMRPGWHGNTCIDTGLALGSGMAALHSRTPQWIPLLEPLAGRAWPIIVVTEASPTDSSGC